MEELSIKNFIEKVEVKRACGDDCEYEVTEVAKGGIGAKINYGRVGFTINGIMMRKTLLEAIICMTISKTALQKEW